MKTRLTILALATTVVSVLAQGTVDFRNTGVSWNDATQDRLVRNVDGTALKGTNFLVQLYWSTDLSLLGSTDKSLTGWTEVNHAINAFRSTSTTLAGAWAVATPDNMRTIWATGPGVLQVRAWDGRGTGASFASATTWGVSAGFAYTIPAASDPPTAYLMENFRGFQLQVPEPSIIGLGILGAIAGLFVFRRRN